MSRFVLPFGLLAVPVGLGLIVPAITARLECGSWSGLGVAFAVAGCGLFACGLAVVLIGPRYHSVRMPSGVRMAIAANIFLLAFLALELCDRSVRQEGRLFYWTTFLLPLALLQFIGLVAGKTWAWWAARGAAAFAVMWFLGFLAIIPFAALQYDGVPAPWYGRVYTAIVTIAFASVFAAAFRSLSRPETRGYFLLPR